MDAKLKKVPYSVYLPPELHEKLTAIAQRRKASEVVRNAIQMIIDGHKEYDSGYNQALHDAMQLVKSNEDAMSISVVGKVIGDKIVDDLKTLTKG